MATTTGEFDHRLEALESRSLLSAAVPAVMPTLLTGELPPADAGFLNPSQDADPVDEGGADQAPGEWTGDNAEVPMSYQDSGNPDFDADYRDWTWDLEGTEIDGGWNTNVPGMGTADGQIHGPGASADRTSMRDRPEVGMALPPGVQAPAADDGADGWVEDEAPVYGPASDAALVAGGPAATVPAGEVKAPQAAVNVPTVEPVKVASLFDASGTGSSDKKDSAKVSLVASFVSADAPRSDALVLPTLL